MLDLARQVAGGAEDIRLLVLPDDPIPDADAIVSIGHAVSYLPDAPAIDRALIAMAKALRPGGMIAIDICDLEYGAERQGSPNLGRVGQDWAIVTEFSTPTPDRFVRQMATFIRNDDGSWRRDDERHDNVLIDTAMIPELLSSEGVTAVVGDSFGDETLPTGLRTVIAHRV
jgi:hypothetical protein